MLIVFTTVFTIVFFFLQYAIKWCQLTALQYYGSNKYSGSRKQLDKSNGNESIARIIKYTENYRIFSLASSSSQRLLDSRRVYARKYYHMLVYFNTPS